jgi:hypothetical protein
MSENDRYAGRKKKGAMMGEQPWSCGISNLGLVNTRRKDLQEKKAAKKAACGWACRNL